MSWHSLWRTRPSSNCNRHAHNFCRLCEDQEGSGGGLFMKAAGMERVQWQGQLAMQRAASLCEQLTAHEKGFGGSGVERERGRRLAEDEDALEEEGPPPGSSPGARALIVEGLVVARCLPFPLLTPSTQGALLAVPHSRHSPPGQPPHAAQNCSQPQRHCGAMDHRGRLAGLP